MNVESLSAINLPTAALAIALVASPYQALAAPMQMNDNVIKRSGVAGPLKVDLVVLPAEEFVKRDSAPLRSGMGMIAVSGAAPVRQDSSAHPNHHMVVAIHSLSSGAVVTDARVSMVFQPIGMSQKSQTVPIVVMQDMGKGAPSTHYGNNVTIAPGRYEVRVGINGKFSKVFQIAIAS